MIGAHVGAVANGSAHVAAPTKADASIVRTQTQDALVGARLEARAGLGYSRRCYATSSADDDRTRGGALLRVATCVVECRSEVFG